MTRKRKDYVKEITISKVLVTIVYMRRNLIFGPIHVFIIIIIIITKLRSICFSSV